MGITGSAMSYHAQRPSGSTTLTMTSNACSMSLHTSDMDIPQLTYAPGQTAEIQDLSERDATGQIEHEQLQLDTSVAMTHQTKSIMVDPQHAAQAVNVRL